ncbi:MAG: hemerythrin domain-containing protein [Betaproteobacteria bacterium]
MNDTVVDRPACAEAASAAPRADLYAPIHKALRHFMTDTLHKVGTLDVADAAESQATLGQLDGLLAMLRGHLGHENHFVHPAIEARQPRGSERTAQDHVEHAQAIDALAAESVALRAAPPARRDVLALRLYRHLALFVAENFQHMHVEETANNAALWTHYSDTELHALHGRLLASLSQAEAAEAMRWMLPALNPAERAGLLQGMRATMPTAAFGAVLDALRPRLPDTAWRKLARALDLDGSPA